MARIYETRDINITAVDSKGQLVQRGEDGNPGRLLAPAGMRVIAGIIVAATGNGATAVKGAHLLRLDGNGLKNGPEAVPMQGHGASVATGNEVGTDARYLGALNFQVEENGGVDMNAEMVGEDLGESMVAATLVFSETEDPEDA